MYDMIMILEVDLYHIILRLDSQVLLYNFFEDSTLGITQWRFFLKQDAEGRDAARFDPVKHVGLCTEVSRSAIPCHALITILAAKITICGDHSRKEESVDR